MTIKPIETRAYGYRFRSRLEARWAVFFTSLGLRWEYEPEGFDIDGEAYLPDFRVWTPQGMPIWYEIKPAHVETDGKFKKFAAALCEGTTWESPAVRATLLSGDPAHCLSENTVCPRCGQVIGNDQADTWPDEAGFLCYECDIETPCGGGNPVEDDGIQGLNYWPHKGWITISHSELARLAHLIDASVGKALSARFEHGETP